jgi:glucosamine-6-phosphate deaminase
MANVYEFGNMSEVPRMAITIGISTILKSKNNFNGLGPN